MKELEDNEDGEIPPEVLVPKYQASDLVAEAAKLKSLEAMSSVPTERLVKILNILQEYNEINLLLLAFLKQVKKID